MTALRDGGRDVIMFANNVAVFVIFSPASTCSSGKDEEVEEERVLSYLSAIQVLLCI